MKLLSLFTEKNHFLKKFIEINENELNQFSSRIFDGLELFYGNREKLLEIIRHLDMEIEKEQNTVSSIDPESKVLLKEILNQKNDFIDQILAQDVEVLTLIETEKANVAKELQDLKKNQKGISGYRLNQPSTRLDAEA